MNKIWNLLPPLQKLKSIEIEYFILFILSILG